MLTFLLTLAFSVDGYPRGDLLIEPADLAKNPAGFLILDVRDEKAYQAGHVPSAIHSSAAEWAKHFQDGKDVAGWSQRLGSLGISTEAKVLVYDDAANKDAARVWWILRYWGVQDVRLLHGMWPGWKAGNHPIRIETTKRSPVEFVPVPQKERLATKQDVLEGLRTKEFAIVDARTANEHTGKTKLAQRGGCIPGAAHLDWENLIDKKTLRFKSADELKKLFAEQHIDLTKPQVVHCQSGGRSSVMHFVMELMGAKSVRNYHASWAEWGNSTDTPVDLPK